MFLSRYSTKANERWHGCVRRVCGHSAYVRPDHLSLLVEWRAYQFNSSSKESAKNLHWYKNVATADERARWDTLFMPTLALPVHKNLNKCKFMFLCTPFCRTFAAQDVEMAVV
jgi:hypothetical protein